MDAMVSLLCFYSLSIPQFFKYNTFKCYILLAINTDAMLWLMRNPVKGGSIEYADNRISLFAAQYGKCAVTGLPMEVHDIHCHHKMPLSKGGTDAYENLILVSKAIHVIIHASSDTIS